MTDQCFYSNQLSLNLFTPIPLVDKGYGFYLAPWGKSATLTSPTGCDINLIREGNEWRLPPPPSPSTTPHTFLASQAAAEMARRKEEVWRYWHGVLRHTSDRNMHCMSLQNSQLPRFPASVPHSCDQCGLYKATQRPIKTSHPTHVPATKMWEHVFVDTTGPFRNATTGGAYYLMVFIDEFSNQGRWYLLKNKAANYNTY